MLVDEILDLLREFGGLWPDASGIANVGHKNPSLGLGQTRLDHVLQMRKVDCRSSWRGQITVTRDEVPNTLFCIAMACNVNVHRVAGLCSTGPKT